jgi:hypothetical protein
VLLDTGKGCGITVKYMIGYARGDAEGGWYGRQCSLDFYVIFLD